MLALAAAAADGAHPFSTTPDHTALARAALGAGKLLCVEQKVVLSHDRDAARAAARGALQVIHTLPSYRACWLRLGFTEHEIDALAHRFVDAVVAHGDEEQIRARVRAHYDAGADHVCIQPLDPAGSPSPDIRALELLNPLKGALS
ncbi:hypothetical protein [Pseudonocardia sp. GCM10023141]|uniref:hypothetical protein n=1 Tax=Pseudonocardia sp. GCM10023141 TaxID=3252653 RepID=UPI00360A9E67